jgi:hypothetical protein
VQVAGAGSAEADWAEEGELNDRTLPLFPPRILSNETMPTIIVNAATNIIRSMLSLLIFTPKISSQFGHIFVNGATKRLSF